MDEECKGQRSRNRVTSTSVEECCSDMCDNKTKPLDMILGSDTAEETNQECLKSSVLGDGDNVVSSVNGQTAASVGDSVLHSAAVCGQRANVKVHHGSVIGKGQVDDRQSLSNPRNSILSPIEHDEPPSHDDVRTLRDRTRQSLVTSPVKLVTTAHSAGVHSVVSCDARPTNHTVQSSTSYASRFVLPREKTIVSNKQIHLVQVMSDFSQRANELLQLQKHHTVIGLDSGHSTDTCQGWSEVKVMWNRPRLRARPLGQLPPAGKKLKYHKLGAVGVSFVRYLQ